MAVPLPAGDKALLSAATATRTREQSVCCSENEWGQLSSVRLLKRESCGWLPPMTPVESQQPNAQSDSPATHPAQRLHRGTAGYAVSPSSTATGQIKVLGHGD